MSVYKEGYYIVDQIMKAQVQIFPDACDFGAPTKRGDKLWNYAKQLANDYGTDVTKVNRYGTGRSAMKRISLRREHQPGMPYDVFVMDFVSCEKGKCKGFDGYLHIYKV